MIAFTIKNDIRGIHLFNHVYKGPILKMKIFSGYEKFAEFIFLICMLCISINILFLRFFDYNLELVRRCDVLFCLVIIECYLDPIVDTQ